MSTSPAPSTSALVAPKARLLPEFISNTVESVNCLSRVILKTVQGAERAVSGVDEITSVLLSQQRERLLAEFGEFQRPNQPKVIEVN